MATRPIPTRTQHSAQTLGEHLRTWRKLQSLTIEQLAARAGVNRETIARVERGDVSVGMGTFLNIARALGLLENLVASLDPYESDFGRARADSALPQRVRP
jgi:transcriptional regulator with XRE-family HTH domain